MTFCDPLVETHERCRDRDHSSLATLGAGAVGVVVARHDAKLFVTGNEIGVAEPERLAGAQTCLGQKREEEPVT